jgi:hypothetical protein
MTDQKSVTNIRATNHSTAHHSRAERRYIGQVIRIVDAEVHNKPNL